MNPVQPWRHDRPVRNQNPGDLRPRRAVPPWPGQAGIDTAPGGPFSIFVSAADGWAALGLWCLDARYLRGLTTAQQMIAVFAPPKENDTASYAASVGRRMRNNGPLDLSNAAVLETLCRAIAHFEESQPGAWSDQEITAGLRLCATLWPRYRAERIAASIAIPEPHPTPVHPTPVHPTPAPVVTADTLNAAELAHIKDTPTA